MKIKHWQGYGSVIARKISEKKVTINEYGAPEKATQVVIHVQGNHEYGIERDDNYDVYNWLVNCSSLYANTPKRELLVSSSFA